MDFLQGTLDMLVLRTLAAAPLHGYAIAQAIRRTSETAFAVEAGSLYPSLQRLELKGMITARWEISERNRKARVYRLTPAGRRALASEISRWDEFVRAIALVLHPAPAKE